MDIMNLQELVDNFSLLEDWEDRYRMLIDLGTALPPMEEALKTDTAKVQGCTSQVWMILGWDENERLTFLADSDALIVKGLVAILLLMFKGKTRDEARAIDVPQTFARLGLEQHLSPNRRSGFFAMVERIARFVNAPCT